MPARNNVEDEQEIKIKLSRRDLEKVFNAVSKKYVPKHIDHKYLPRAYFDTLTLLLDRNNISVRMQYKEGKSARIGGYEQTVKVEAPHTGQLAKGARIRREVKNIRGADYKPDLSIVTDRKAKPFLRPFLRRKLEHIFTAAIERRYFEVEIGHGKHKGTVEIAFDVGEIILPHNGRHYPFFEIELEKKGGSHEALDSLRDAILKTASSARLQKLSKSQQGTKLYRRSMPKQAAPSA